VAITDWKEIPDDAAAPAQGYPGHPSHPPLTDVSIGAATIAAVLLVLGEVGVETPAMAHGALLAPLPA
jgi:hypothetical protein